MESSLLKTIGQIAAIGGISLGIILLLFKDAVQQQIIPLFKEKELGKIMMKNLRTGVWTIAVAGVAAWVFSSFGGADALKVTNNEFSGDMIFVSDASILSQLKLEGVENADYPEITNQLAKASKLVKTNNFEEAIPIYQQVASKANISSVFNNLGLLYAATNDKENAKANYAKSVSLDPTEQAAQYNLGLLEESLGNLNEALERFNKAPDISDANQLARKIRKSVKAGAVESEPNNDNFEANVIPLEKVVLASIETKTDADFFMFKTPEIRRDWIRVKIINQSNTLMATLHIYDSKKEEIHSGSASTKGQDYSLDFTVTPDTEYYVRVGSEYFSKSSGAYQIEIIPLRKYDKYEPNDNKQNPRSIGINKTISANIMDRNDRDYYELDISDEGVYTIQLTNKSSTLTPYLEALDEKKEQIAHSQASSPGQDFSLDFQANANAKHYIQVTTEYFSRSSGAYELVVRKK